MYETLILLIDTFRAAQDIAVATLIRDLHIPQPKSNIDWVHFCSARALHETKELHGVGLYPHGYGIKLKIGPLTIDFDWGANGELDGFDGWRLYNFSIDNLPTIECTHFGVNELLNAALADGEVIKSGNLYYDPKRRAPNDGALAT